MRSMRIATLALISGAVVGLSAPAALALADPSGSTSPSAPVGKAFRNAAPSMSASPSMPSSMSPRKALRSLIKARAGQAPKGAAKTGLGGSVNSTDVAETAAGAILVVSAAGVFVAARRRGGGA